VPDAATPSTASRQQTLLVAVLAEGGSFISFARGEARSCAYEAIR
jgi:hypothetical protein